MYGDTSVIVGVLFEFDVGNDYCVWIEKLRGVLLSLYIMTVHSRDCDLKGWISRSVVTEII